MYIIYTSTFSAAETSPGLPANKYLGRCVTRTQRLFYLPCSGCYHFFSNINFFRKLRVPFCSYPFSASDKDFCCHSFQSASYYGIESNERRLDICFLVTDATVIGFSSSSSFSFSPAITDAVTTRTTAAVAAIRTTAAVAVTDF